MTIVVLGGAVFAPGLFQGTGYLWKLKTSLHRRCRCGRGGRKEEEPLPPPQQQLSSLSSLL